MTDPLRFDDLGFARPDVGREARQGLAEVIYGPGKRTGEIVALVRHALSANSGPVLVTRVDTEVAAVATAEAAGGEYLADARLLAWRPAAPIGFTVAVVSGGTADGPVAREAEAVSRVLGLATEYVPDVGVAGIHRVLAEVNRLRAADAVICVAGMEGALPSVVGGLVAAPVIAVPTSVGYGASLDGVTPLLAMMSSCAAGTVVVNIDSGFGAAMAAFRIARTASRAER
jgi:pyridinium-3,5-biscarboxylic acid mononucleotide synthase